MKSNYFFHIPFDITLLLPIETICQCVSGSVRVFALSENVGKMSIFSIEQRVFGKLLHFLIEPQELSQYNK